MNLRYICVLCMVVFPTTVHAQFFQGLLYNLDKILNFFSFGLIDIVPEPGLSDIDDDLPGGIIFGGLCNSLKNFASNQFLDEPIQEIVEGIECGCRFLGLGGEMNFGCNFKEPQCITLDELPFDDFEEEALLNSFTPTAAPVPAQKLEVCATAMVRAKYDGRSLLTPFQPETLTTRACAQLVNATFLPVNVTVPKLCATVEHNEGLLNLLSLKSCAIFVSRPDDSIEECNKCEICGEGGLGVSFDCSNINLDNSKKNNWTIPAFSTCVSAGTMALSQVDGDDASASELTYRPFLTPIP